MTYPIDMINIFINKITTQKCTLKKCADDLLISYGTIKKWNKQYINNIRMKIPIITRTKSYHIHSNNKRTHLKDKVITYVTKNTGCGLYDIYKYINKQI